MRIKWVSTWKTLGMEPSKSCEDQMLAITLSRKDHSKLPRFDIVTWSFAQWLGLSEFSVYGNKNFSKNARYSSRSVFSWQLPNFLRSRARSVSRILCCHGRDTAERGGPLKPPPVWFCILQHRSCFPVSCTSGCHLRRRSFPSILHYNLLTSEK